MPNYPLSFPGVGVKRSSFRLKRIVGVSESPFTGTQQIYRFAGEWWEGDVTFRPCKRADASLIQSFLAQLRGSSGTFLYGDPDALNQGVMGSGGVIRVNGDAQAGNSLIVDGMTPLAQNILLPGDYFQLGGGMSSRLYMCTSSLNADGAGGGVVNFEPALRASPLDNELLILSNPKTLMRLTENVAEWSSDSHGWFDGLSLSFREVL
ncbi:MAG: hypothetical protein E6Q97_04215 [Desulfurellales bacterium]|nr:MAG: hypothetical protein E6Q97_04215 [Desulfurellales bacterium]